MKKITANKGHISFDVSGSLHLDITEEGIIVADDVAALCEERLGSQISVSDVSAKEAAEAASDASEGGSVDGPVVPTKKMSVENLRILAKSEGASEEDVDGAATKDALIALILANREKAGEGAGSPE